MKALTITQPWAQLIIDGRKHLETRSWRPSIALPFRVAIHASKGWFASDREFARTLGYDPLTLPGGMVLGTATVARVVSTNNSVAWGLNAPDDVAPNGYSVNEFGRLVLFLPESEFGDFSGGRWAWELTDVHRFIDPIQARGSLGLWEWSGLTSQRASGTVTSPRLPHEEPR